MVHRAMPPLYHFIHIIDRPLFSALSKFQAFGLENVPDSGGVLMMANHASYLDPVYIGSAVNRNMRYMARSTLFKPWIIERFLLSINAFPVHRGAPDRKAIRQALKVLEGGDLLLIFPEGTRTIDGSLGEAQAGVGLIAHKTAAPVMPVFLNGTRNVLPRNAKMLKPAKVTISFGKPLDMEHYRRSKASRETYVEIGEEIMAKMSELEKGNAIPSREL